MKYLSAAVFGVAMFLLGAIGVPSAQGVRADRSGLNFDTALPERVHVGDDIKIGTQGCRVAQSRGEWIRCESSREWRNLYNGSTYLIVEPPSR